MAMEDELSARFRDMQKSRDRKWYRLNPPANGTIDLEERQRKHFAQGINGYKLMLVCFVGSFAGVVVESIWCILRHGYLESRAGLVYGPFNLLYGVGALTLTLALYRFRNRGRWLSFLGGMLVGSVVEYICSWGQGIDPRLSLVGITAGCRLISTAESVCSIPASGVCWVYFGLRTSTRAWQSGF